MYNIFCINYFKEICLKKVDILHSDMMYNVGIEFGENEVIMYDVVYSSCLCTVYWNLMCYVIPVTVKINRYTNYFEIT